METGSTISQFDGLSDYMGQIAFSGEGDIAFVGSYGSSYLYILAPDLSTISVTAVSLRVPKIGGELMFFSSMKMENRSS